MHPNYSAHPAVEHSARMLANLPARTGRSLEQWVGLLRDAGIDTEAAQTTWLRDQHKLGGGTIDMITSAARGRSLAWGDVDTYLAEAPGYVDALYQSRPALRPLHDALIAGWRQIAPAARICPAKTLVSIYHRHACGKLRPATRLDLELGLSLRGVQPPPRVQPHSGAAADDRINHRVRLRSLAEIDAELLHWMGVAYAQAGD